MKQKRKNCREESLNEQDNIKKIKLDFSALNPMVFYPGFPHIAEKIFKKLDNKSLKNCREVAKTWQNCIDNRGILWNKIVKREFRNKLFHLACINGNSKIAEILLKSYLVIKFDPNAISGINGEYNNWDIPWRTPFQWASWNGHSNIGKPNF